MSRQVIIHQSCSFRICGGYIMIMSGPTKYLYIWSGCLLTCVIIKTHGALWSSCNQWLLAVVTEVIPGSATRRRRNMISYCYIQIFSEKKCSTRGIEICLLTIEWEDIQFSAPRPDGAPRQRISSPQCAFEVPMFIEPCNSHQFSL